MVAIEDVLKYFRMGLSIIPLNRGEKKPSIKWEEYQHHIASMEEIHSWFDRSDSNFGIICGKVSGNLVVLDFDDEQVIPFIFHDFEKLKSRTMVTRTGKGYHIYLRAPNSVPSGKVSQIHLDIQSEGKYVVGPGSLPPSGAIYNAIGSTTISEMKDFDKFLDSIKDRAQLYEAAKFMSTVWEAGNRHEIALRLASLLRKQLHWTIEDVKDFILSIMRMKGDTSEIHDRERAIEDAFTKDYPYVTSDFPKEFVDEVIRLLPSSSNEIWRVNLNEEGSQAIYCDPSGVFVFKQTKDAKHIFPVFSAPLKLMDCYFIAGSNENDLIFSFTLGDEKYTGSKIDVATMLGSSGRTGINSKYFVEVVNACVEYYISKKIVIPREAYAAIGIYKRHAKFEIAMPGINGIDISTEYGEEPWFVEHSWKKFNGDFRKSLDALNRLWEFFDPTYVALLAGFSVISPFYFSMKEDGDFYIPLMILHGPRGTGKTTLGSIFSTKMYSASAGDPSDLTSEFRLLDFLNGTTFPRLADESENVKFEGNKFSEKASATLKYNSYRQIVGTRGEIKFRRVQKRIYYGRTPLIIAGNKIDMNDPALLSRSIFLNFIKKPTGSRSILRDEILSQLDIGFGQEIVKYAAEKFTYIELLNEIRNIHFNFSFRDSRREDMYASIYVGLKILSDIYRLNGMDFSLQSYLDLANFEKIISRIEEENSSEEAERQSIQILIEWAKTMADTLNSFSAENIPFNVQLLSNNISLKDENGKKMVYIGQTALNTFLSENRDILFRTLSQASEELSKYFNAPKEVFYDRKTVKINNHPLKVLKIPYDEIGIDSYGDPPPEPPRGPPPDGVEPLKNGKNEKGNQWLPLVTQLVTRLDTVKHSLQNKKVTSNQTDYPYIRKNNFLNFDRMHRKEWLLVTFSITTTYKPLNLLYYRRIIKGNQKVTKGNQWLPIFYYSSIKSIDLENLCSGFESFEKSGRYYYKIENPYINSKSWNSFVLSSSPISDKAYDALKGEATADSPLLSFLPGTVRDISLKMQKSEDAVAHELSDLAIRGRVSQGENGIFEVV